jgi:uncharacterized lipoprotein YddW (UPF0748 family)
MSPKRALRAAAALATALLSLVAVPGAALAGAPAPGEMRGLWVVRTALVSPEEVDRVVDQAAAGGFNALFVQVRGRGDAFYRSQLVPRSVLLGQKQKDFDPLAYLLVRARARRLQVHAWVNVLLTAHFGQPLPPGHVLASHPEWAMVPRSAAEPALSASGSRRLALVLAAGRNEGDVEGFYLSPSVPEVGEHLEAVVRELVGGYEIDGLHLDFVRYPGPSYDYSRAALEDFRRSRGAKGELLAVAAGSPAAWDDYRRSVLTALISRLADAARARRPGIVVSAAVAPDEAQAVNHKFQDWPRWLEGGVLAALCPMTYTPENRLFQQQVEAALQLAHGRPVWAGVGAYRLDPAGVVEKVELARQAGAGGVVLFSHESLEPAHLRSLREQAFTSSRAGDRREGGRVTGAR